MQSRYGCHNRRDYRPRYFVQDGWWHDGWAKTAKLAQVGFVMAESCQYTHSNLGQADERCQGCKHRVDLSAVAGHNSGTPASQR